MDFLNSLIELKEFKRGPFTIVLDDALSNCFIYNPHAPEPDPQVEITVYERTFEQNEDLGINDMNV
jgi:zinc finger protein